MTMIRRRPMRSARNASGSAMTMPGAHDRAGDADAGVVDAEVVGREVDGLGEQRVDERRRSSTPRRAGRAPATWRSSSRSGGAHHGVRPGRPWCAAEHARRTACTGARTASRTRDREPVAGASRRARAVGVRHVRSYCEKRPVGLVNTCRRGCGDLRVDAGRRAGARVGRRDAPGRRATRRVTVRPPAQHGRSILVGHESARCPSDRRRLLNDHDRRAAHGPAGRRGRRARAPRTRCSS